MNRSVRCLLVALWACLTTISWAAAEEKAVTKPATPYVRLNAADAVDEVESSIAHAKTYVQWEQTEGVAREWWETFEKENQRQRKLVLALIEELIKRDATVYEFFVAYVYSESDNIEETLKFLDRMKEEQRRQASVDDRRQASVDARLDRLDDARQGPSSCGRSAEREQIRERVGWRTVSGDARRWWAEFEETECGSGALVEEVLWQLDQRKATIEELFLAYVGHPSRSLTEALRSLPIGGRSDGSSTPPRSSTRAEPARRGEPTPALPEERAPATGSDRSMAGGSS